MLTLQELNLPEPFSPAAFAELILSNFSGIRQDLLTLSQEHNSELVFNMIHGVGELSSQTDSTRRDANAWIPVLKALDTKLHTMMLRNLTSEVLYDLPPSVSTLVVTEMDDINPMVTDWLSDTSAEITREIEIIYQGAQTMDVAEFHGLNPNIVYLNLPLNQDLDELLERNPRLRTVGINAETFEFTLPSKETREISIWSATPEKYSSVIARTPRRASSMKCVRKIW